MDEIGWESWGAYGSQDDGADAPRSVIGNALVMCDGPGEGDEACGGGEEGCGAEGEDGGVVI
jgi:hypothetical protein